MGKRLRRKFHLFPGEKVKFKCHDSNKEYYIKGVYPTDHVSEGKTWYEQPDLIAIVKARKTHRCSRCGRLIESRRGLITRQIIKQDYYVGISYFGCEPPEWGYDVKFCLPCAKEVFKGVKVYRCDGSCFLYDAGWYEKLPKLDKPALDFEAELKKFENH